MFWPFINFILLISLCIDFVNLWFLFHQVINLLCKTCNIAHYQSLILDSFLLHFYWEQSWRICEPTWSYCCQKTLDLFLFYVVQCRRIYNSAFGLFFQKILDPFFFYYNLTSCNLGDFTIPTFSFFPHFIALSLHEIKYSRLHFTHQYFTCKTFFAVSRITECRISASTAGFAKQKSYKLKKKVRKSGRFPEVMS